MYKESIYNCYVKSESGFLIFNSFSRAVIEVEDSAFVKNALNKNNETDLDLLYKNGFIVNESTNEEGIMKYLYNKKYFNTESQAIILMPTLKCNFNCPYCFEKGVSIDENKNYFDSIYKYISINSNRFNKLYIGLFGGEPLLKSREIVSFLKKTKKLADKTNFQLYTSMVTNGSLLNSNFIDELTKFSCKYIQITFDGTRERHNKSRVSSIGDPSFDLLINNMECLASVSHSNAEFKAIMRINIENESVEDVVTTLKAVNKKYRNDIHVLIRRVFNTCMYTTTSKKDCSIQKYYEAANSLGYKSFKNRNLFSSCESCGDLNTVHILPDLSIYKCVNDLNYKGSKIGKLTDEGEMILDSKNLQMWYESANFFSDPKCSRCEKSASSMGGCILHKRRTGRRNCSSIEHILGGYL